MRRRISGGRQRQGQTHLPRTRALLGFLLLLLNNVVQAFHHHPPPIPQISSSFSTVGAVRRKATRMSVVPQQDNQHKTSWWRDPQALRRLLDPAAAGASQSHTHTTEDSTTNSNSIIPPSWFPTLSPRNLKRTAFSLFLPILLSINGDALFFSSPTPSSFSFRPPSANAIDSIKVGSCLLQNCQLELARCILDPKCLANVICLNTCNNKPDEVGCQIGCGDLFENDIVGQFNACALSKKQCVPRKEDDGAFPVPPMSAVFNQFDMNAFKGKWYISAGLNPLFDIFDCQVHFFTIQGGKLYGKLNWRITEPDGEFFTRNTVQRFVQDPENPGVLYNHDNEYLHYQDDWYILDYEPNQFILVYYRGQNDAWTGYGGAVVYTKASTVPAKYKERIKSAYAKAGVDYGKFKEVDNSCSDLTTTPTALRAEYARRLFLTEEKALQESLTRARGSAENALMMGEEEAQAAVKELEKVISDFEGGIEKEVRREVRLIEEEVEEVEKVLDNRLWGSSNQGKLDDMATRLQSRPLSDPRAK